MIWKGRRELQRDFGGSLALKVSDWISKELRRHGQSPNLLDLNLIKKIRGTTKTFRWKDIQSTVYYKSKKFEITSVTIQQGNIAL